MCRHTSGNCILDLHEVLAGGRNNFSSSSEELLTQQTLPLCCPTSTNHARQRPPASFPCAPAIHVCVWTTQSSDFNLAVWSFTSAPGTYHLLRPMCQSCPTVSSPASATCSCQAEPGAQQLVPHGTLFKCSPWHGHKLNELSLQQLCFSHSHLSTAVLASSSSILGMERLMFHLNVAQSLPSPKQLSGSSLPGQCSTAETQWRLADTLWFLHLDLCVF